jgi:hypothetical protein
MFSRCKHWWVLIVPKEGRCHKRCSKCGKEKKCGRNG